MTLSLYFSLSHTQFGLVKCLHHLTPHQHPSSLDIALRSHSKSAFTMNDASLTAQQTFHFISQITWNSSLLTQAQPLGSKPIFSPSSCLLSSAIVTTADFATWLRLTCGYTPADLSPEITLINLHLHQGKDDNHGAYIYSTIISCEHMDGGQGLKASG